ncbi:hypothetical protein FGG78_42400 [Thioclava sp. BHET1]|nr:hypothetical protein FGG78_42400 [Thioclava sp. BHET1]
MYLSSLPDLAQALGPVLRRRSWRGQFSSSASARGSVVACAMAASITGLSGALQRGFGLNGMAMVF